MNPSDRRQHVIALWTALLVTVLWSSSWVLIRFGLDDEDLSPLTFAGMRYALAAIVLVGIVLSRPARRAEVAALGRRTVLRLCVLGVVFYSLTQGAQFVAIDNQPAATTSLVLSLTPLLVGVLGARALGERPTARQLAGAVIVVAGAWVYLGGGLGTTMVGMVAALIALGSNVGASMLGRSANRHGAHSPLVVTAVSMAVGSVVLLAVGVSAEGLPELSGRAGAILVWLAVVNTALAFTLWNLSLRRLSALESAGINNTMLIQIAALAWIFLGEEPGLLGVVGIVLVSVGVFFTQAITAGSDSSRIGTAPRSEERLP